MCVKTLIEEVQNSRSRITRIFANHLASLGVQPSTPIAIALSGGPDSIALSLLVSMWCNHERKPTGISSLLEHLHHQATSSIIEFNCPASYRVRGYRADFL